MVKKNLADNPAVQARVEAVMARMDEEELQALANHAAKIDVQNIVPNAPLGTMPVILPVEATLEHILQELAQLEGQCGAASTIEHALHKAAEFVRLAKIDVKYL